MPDKAQQKIIDSYHERVIALLLKQAHARRFQTWAEEEKIIAEIEKVEAERKQYENSIRKETKNEEHSESPQG